MPSSLARLLRTRPKCLAYERRRFGYPRLSMLLRRDAQSSTAKRVCRLCREKRPTAWRPKRAMGVWAPLVLPVAPNQRWSLDFIADQMTDGWRFRILSVVDDCTRECLALVADTAISGKRVAREPDRVVFTRGHPA